MPININERIWKREQAVVLIELARRLEELSMRSGVSTATGTGSPEGVVVAPVGTLFLRSNGGANTTLYVKESGSGNTGWIAK